MSLPQITKLPAIRNDFLRLYLETVEDTESPRLFHIWAVLSSIGACLGRRAFFPFIPSNLFANEYIILVGPPGVRKSTAISIAHRFVRNATSIRFAPKDTAGQRQGLIAAIIGAKEDTQDDVVQVNGHKMTPEFLSSLEMKVVNKYDEHVLYASASELSTFIGKNNSEMLTFLQEMYDGEDYAYQLAKTKETLHHPLLSILGATNPTAIADSMPVAAVGQGFMSRVILVYSDKKYKMVPRPRQFDAALCREVERRFSYIAYNLSGEFSEDRSAGVLLDELYHYQVDLTDNRFIYYQERRHTHLIKIAMVLAAGCLRQEIRREDIEQAHAILVATERNMPDALGEYGLSPMAMAKQRLVEFVRQAKKAIDPKILYLVMQRDMTLANFKAALADLVNAGKLIEVKTSDGPAFATPYVNENDRLNELLAFTGDNNE